jgi:iron complex outermembrane recepter protein
VGIVRDATGATLQNVTISVRGPAHGSTLTGRDGRFQLLNLPEGDYELDAELSGFAPARRVVRVVTGQTADVDVTLAVHVLEETVVTAAKTGERDVQKLPMAISVLPAADLQRTESHTIAQIAGLAPSVTFSQNSDFSQLTIRGIGSNVVFAGSDPSSAVYLDGVYLARPVAVLADFLELERIEVLRGPRGTLYGRNAVGGALNLVTKEPTNDFAASARFSVGTHDALRTEAAVSGPLVRGRVLASGAILRGVRDGFVRDLNHPDHPLGGEDATAGRGKLLVVLNRRMDLTLSGDFTRHDPAPLTYAKVLAVKPGFQVDNPADLHEVRASTLAEGHTYQHGAAARFTMRLAPETTLVSLTAYRKLDYQVINDADITELDLTAVDLREFHHQWSQELTISREGPGLSWIGGLFLFDEDDHQPTVVRLGGPRLLNFLDPTVDASAGALFGQATVDLTRGLSASTGLRYTTERKSIVNSGRLQTIDEPAVVLPSSEYAYTDAISYSAWTPRFGLDFRMRPDTFAYVSAARGFKSGGFNFTSPEPGRGYAPEWAWSYEGGLKAALAGGRARINLAVFHTDYTDLQVQTPIRPGVIDISNAAEATIRGIELEGTARIGPSVRAGGHIAWLTAKYDHYTAVGIGGITGDAAGHRLSNAPQWSGRAWFDWSADIGRGSLLSVRADTRWQSTVYFTPFNDAIQRQPAYGVLDASVEFGPRRRHWSVAAFARNLTNQDYITGTFATPPPAIGGRPGEPRQAGVQLTLRH